MIGSGGVVVLLYAMGTALVAYAAVQTVEWERALGQYRSFYHAQFTSEAHVRRELWRIKIRRFLLMDLSWTFVWSLGFFAWVHVASA